MKKRITAVSLCALFLMLAASAFAARPAKYNAQELIRSRSAIVWIGGRRVADLMVGADAKLQFQFIDKTLSRAIYSEASNFPDALVWNAGYIDKAAKGKCNLVLLIYRAVTRWTFDPSKITVNGQPIPKNRIYTSLLSKQTGSLAMDTQDVIAFGVPRSESKPGSVITFGYGEYTAEFTVPEK